MTRTITSRAPGSGTSISSSWKASVGSPSRSWRMTHAVIVSGSVPGSTPTSLTLVRSTCAMCWFGPPGRERADRTAGAELWPSAPFCQTRDVRCDVTPMEAATPLRKAQVRTIGDRLVIEDLVVEDQSAVQLVREREEAGEDAAAVVTDAIEIGARVLDREQAGANAEFVRTEFDKTSREVEAAFTEKAGQVGEELKSMLEAVFGPDNGHLARALERHFSDESSTAVQHRVRELVAEVMTKSREDLLKQFSSADGQNPLADFKAGTLD